LEHNRFYEFTGSSKAALAWAFTRSRQRAPSKEVPPGAVSALDLIVGIFLAHREDSECSQLFSHYRLSPELLYDALRADGGFAPDGAPSSPERLDKMPPLDPEAEQIVDASLILTQKFNPENDHLSRLRDLFGGILGTPNRAKGLLQQTLASAGAPFEKLASAYPEFLRYPSGEMTFSRFLAERFPLMEATQSDVPLSPRFTVSGFSADTRTELDLIGIGAEVDAFAYLIAAKALQPPMAIGLFGDWGSGKSFFMEALRQRIHKITADAQQSGEPQGKISIYKYIAQIEFNAWHYVEGELWASLVEHIFRNLKTRQGDEPTLLQQRQQVVIEKLEVKRRAQQVAQARKAELESQLSQTQKRVIELGKEREDALKKLNELKALDVLKGVKLSDKEKEDISRVLNDMGVTQTYRNAAELMRGSDELRAVLERGNALITPLRERGWKWAGALIFVVLIGPAIGFALKSIDNQFPPVTNALASVSAFLSGLVILLKQGTSWLSGALARVEGARMKLDEKRSEVETQYGSLIAEAERQYTEKTVAYDQAKNEEKEKTREIAELEQELQQITPGRMLLDFINERVGSQDYRKHLGIAALIRSDFEQLSQLITDRNKEFGEKDDGTVREEDRHLINRIVLYIDDLDRCPPERVVQVLQAVHLLLAFPLFVVVVAVDARWLAQSLQRHYQNLLAVNARRDGVELSEGFGRQASPQDYLEKIFQVPFWVRPLPEKARIRIVQGLIANSLVPSSLVNAVGGTKGQGNGQQGASDKGAATVEREQTVVHWEASERRRPLNMKAETDLKPIGLDIQKIELQFMNELRSLLGQTPRSVKRFVNVYRLIKAVSLDQSPKFVEDRPDADFKLVLFLLAVLTGLPSISREFFRLLSTERLKIEQAKTLSVGVPTAEPSHSLSHVLEALRGIVLGAPEALTVSAVLAVQQAGATSEIDRNGPKCSVGHENWYACREFDRIELWLKQYDSGRWLSLDATALADWTPQVVRFSYRIEELSSG